MAERILDFIIERIFPWAMVAFFVAIPVGGVLMIYALATSNKPTCEEMGGKYELLYYVPTQVGNQTIMQPIYECRIPKEFVNR